MFIIRIIARTLASALEVVELLMLVRAILSWFPTNRSNKFFDIMYLVTDFFIRPVRTFMARHNFASSLPIDISFLVTFILISIAERLLYTI